MAVEGEKIIPVEIEEEMKNSYLTYSMSVIIGRALPDVRDGLKPIHRRILYAMQELDLGSTRPYKKSARIVGEVMGKYHPHGDLAIYESLVRMAQNFSLRYLLIDGQGNFGSLDGDAPAAMRYTEARLTPFAEEMLRDIERDTVDKVDNFEGSLKEPVILPAAFPNLLVNGSSGIAVGMATNIPPHNLTEVIDGIVAFLENPEISIDELMEYIKGPDFPGGGLIVGREGIRQAFHTGRGNITLKARVNIEKTKSARENIIISELPYQVNKALLIERIAELVKEGQIEGISNVRDESDREGMRIVIELKREAQPEVVLAQLYLHTSLQSTFGVIALVIVEGRPRVLNLKELIHYFIEHRKEVVTRRTKFELKRAEKRSHILEGLKIAVRNIEEVIKIIRHARAVQEASKKLQERFKLTSEQASAILEMRLQRLTQLQQAELEEEYLKLIKAIEEYQLILKSEGKLISIIKEELLRLKEKYGDFRRTEIIEEEASFKIEDTIADETVVVTISHSGYIKRISESTYRQQRRGGKGITGMGLKEDDFVEHLFIASTHDYILFFTDQGRCYWVKVYELPQATRISRGKAIVNLIELKPGEKIKAFIPIRKFEPGRFLVMVTKQGMIKKTSLSEYSRPRRGGINAIELTPGDTLCEVKLTNGHQEIIIGTRRGQAIRFDEREVRPTSRVSQGVRGIRLTPGDEVISAIAVRREEATLLVVSSKGYGKRTVLSDYRITARGGKGIITMRTSEKVGDVVSILEVEELEELMLVTQRGTIVRLAIKDISVIGRATQGVKLIKLSEGEEVVDVCHVAEEK
jgi:DNA gyrase subunit A